MREVGEDEKDDVENEEEEERNKNKKKQDLRRTRREAVSVAYQVRQVGTDDATSARDADADTNGGGSDDGGEQLGAVQVDDQE